MNTATDFKSEEFRLAKYLRSSPEYVEYFKRHRESIKRIGYGRWNNIEFLDELIENYGKTLWLVIPTVGLMIPQPIRNYSIITYYIDYRELCHSDISRAEKYCGHYEKLRDNETLTDWEMIADPVFYRYWNNLTEMFFNKEEAKNYCIALTEFSKYNDIFSMSFK